jgi:hypothetical protein
LQNRGEQWVLVQDGRRSFENASLVAQLSRDARNPGANTGLRGHHGAAGIQDPS